MPLRPPAAALLVAGLLLPAGWIQAQETALPPDEAGAKAVLETSPRHGEFVDIAVPGQQTPVTTFVVYPERAEKAPVVIVIQEIYGLTDWIMGVADRLAAEGFIALAPDLGSGRGPSGGGTSAFTSRNDVVAAVRTLTPEFVMGALDAVREYGRTLPAANGRSATVGYCWGGSTSFQYAVHQPGLDAAVIYYGTSPPEAGDYARIQAPIRSWTSPVNS